MFEPIRGSAHKHVGEDVANPTTAIWAREMLLGQLGEGEAAFRIQEVIEEVLEEGSFE